MHASPEHPPFDSQTASTTTGESGARPIWETAHNENLKKLPNHLKQFVVDQQYEKYTPIDHAVWRYVMRQNYAFLKTNAHEAYVEGLRRTGISIEYIPSIYEMNDILSKIGWACVTVDGFIPPAAFMEYQAYRVLVIAADMRQINHIEYTPAPDIIHEAAGHAPIIADPLYAEYLRRIGEIGARAISSRKDFELYEAIRHLSILKELPNADPREIAVAERDVTERQNNLGDPSEMARLSRMHWWTVEYGLIGDLTKPKIYGAGLLSSIGESANCLTDKVKKISYDITAADYAFDITTQQPQLFVTPNFQHLIDVLEEFAETMAFRTGGLAGLEKAIECSNVCSAVYSSGLQVTGRFVEAIDFNAVQPAFIRAAGPCALSFQGRQIEGHGKAAYPDGFASPVGKLRGVNLPMESMTDADLAAHKIILNSEVHLLFESGVSVGGRLEQIIRRENRVVLMTFSNCIVEKDGIILLTKSTYTMAIGEKIVSVFCGAADKDAYDQVSLVPKERTTKSAVDDNTRALADLYRDIRAYRQQDSTDGRIVEIWKTLQKSHPDDWLASLEILELMTTRRIFTLYAAEIKISLLTKAQDTPALTTLIIDGLKLIEIRPAA